MPGGDDEKQLSHEALTTWMTISKFLWWLVLFIIITSVPVLSHALTTMLKNRTSHYFHFLTSMIVANLLMLFAICLNLVSDYLFHSLKGALMCKTTAFITNTTACYVNWVWVTMFAQRFVYVFFPMGHKRIQWLVTFIEDTRKLLIITGIMALFTQSWSPILMTENLIRNQGGQIVGSFCGPNTNMVSEHLFKWIAVAESMLTYAIPFFITVVTDMAVVGWNQKGAKFTVISTENMKSQANSSSTGLTPPSSFKIQSEKSLLRCHTRRQRAMRRCLMMATIQLLLNTPYYILQLADEFVALRATKSGYIFYLYADAIFYLLYLVQFPMIAIYVHTQFTSDSSRRKEQGTHLLATSNSNSPRLGHLSSPRLF
ncbi:hypothetical protein QR680_002382 [Steinernema hermaphroditum]|uniref:G-protein coupled receptors family 1 profile domain-containing protein n=1 Tax=Steinernema hermaphroditum TaxID=289476 RepID=A0AA39H2H0_9BILA|nr:hypothetical protein QR680_002382 [Steinernema hermaphroditum]